MNRFAPITCIFIHIFFVFATMDEVQKFKDPIQILLMLSDEDVSDCVSRFNINASKNDNITKPYSDLAYYGCAYNCMFTKAGLIEAPYIIKPDNISSSFSDYVKMFKSYDLDEIKTCLQETNSPRIIDELMKDDQTMNDIQISCSLGILRYLCVHSFF